jgi:hypothetical protein
MKQFEEYRQIPDLWSWIVIALIGLSVVGWGLMNVLLVHDRQREWDYGTLPDVPGQSIYSTGQTGGQATPPPQIAPLPPAATRPAATAPAPTTAPATGPRSEGRP